MPVNPASKPLRELAVPKKPEMKFLLAKIFNPMPNTNP
jgi:hypothetical protein